MNRVKLFPRYLVDNGLIFEINRRVLHPLGLALVVDIDGKDRRKLSITDLFETFTTPGNCDAKVVPSYIPSVYLTLPFIFLSKLARQ